MLKQLRVANEVRAKEWDGNIDAGPLYKAVELGGEVGEALNIVKKLERERLGIRGSRDNVAHLAEELADIVICTDLLGMAYGIDLVAAVKAKFNLTSVNVGLETRL